VLDEAIKVFRSQKDLADRALAQVSDANLHVSLDANTNSIAVIMKHVAGNLLSRWTDFLTTDGEKPWRNRDDEFVDTFTARDELLAYWESGWQRLFDSLESLTAGDLGKAVTIRGEPHTVPLAIQRSLAHCGYHVGQIVLIARILAGDHWTTITIPRGASAGFNNHDRDPRFHASRQQLDRERLLAFQAKWIDGVQLIHRRTQDQLLQESQATVEISPQLASHGSIIERLRELAPGDLSFRNQISACPDSLRRSERPSHIWDFWPARQVKPALADHKQGGTIWSCGNRTPKLFKKGG